MAFNIDLKQVKEQQNSVQESEEQTITDEVTNEIQESDTNIESSNRKFNVNLHDIKESKEYEELLNDFDIGDNIAESFVSAIGTGIGVNAFVNDSILNEARAVLKTVVRKGKLTQKVVCPPGFKAVKGGCEKKTAKDVIAFARRAKKAAKTKMSRKGAQKASIKSRNRSMLIRNKNSAAVERIRSM